MGVAAEAAHWRAGTTPAPSRMTHVKMRSFMPPGAAVDIDAEAVEVARENVARNGRDGTSGETHGKERAAKRHPTRRTGRPKKHDPVPAERGGEVGNVLQRDSPLSGLESAEHRDRKSVV